MQTQLTEILGQMSQGQVASWGIFFLEDNFQALRTKYRWNPIAFSAIKVLEWRVRRTLSKIALGKDKPITATFKQIEKARRFADTLWSHNWFGNTFFVGCWCICAFMADFQCGYESANDGDPDPDFERKIYQNLAEVASKQASMVDEEKDRYLSKLLLKATEIVGRRT